MFEIEELLNLFDNDDVKKIILSSYILSQKKNKQLSDEIFQQLLLLKKTFQNIEIKINTDSTSISKYMDNIIHLNGDFNELTFFHELTHLLSDMYSIFSIPQEYIEFKNNFLSSQENCSLLVLFLKLCNEEKKKILKNLALKPQLKNNFENINKIEILKSTEEEFIELSVIMSVEDIVDSITGGKVFDLGLNYSKDDNHIVQKTPRGAGHGCAYFRKTGYEFEEILAEYQAIKLVDPTNSLFNMLKTILGSEFICFLDNKCQVISGKKNDLEMNNKNI